MSVYLDDNAGRSCSVLQKGSRRVRPSGGHDASQGPGRAQDNRGAAGSRLRGVLSDHKHSAVHTDRLPHSQRYRDTHESSVFRAPGSDDNNDTCCHPADRCLRNGSRQEGGQINV